MTQCVGTVVLLVLYKGHDAVCVYDCCCCCHYSSKRHDAVCMYDCVVVVTIAVKDMRQYACMTVLLSL